MLLWVWEWYSFRAQPWMRAIISQASDVAAEELPDEDVRCPRWRPICMPWNFVREGGRAPHNARAVSFLLCHSELTTPRVVNRHLERQPQTDADQRGGADVRQGSGLSWLTGDLF